MHRVVLDTNVLVSALLRQEGPTATLRIAWLTNKLTPCFSPSTLDELRDVLQRPWFMKSSQFQQDEIDEYLERLARDSIICEPQTIELISRDPDDNHILAAALACEADIIITGDKDLLVLKPRYRNIPILTPAEYIMEFIT